jgi:hypothetical protein
MPSLQEHHFIAFCLPPVGVAGGIRQTPICLDLNNLPDKKFAAKLPDNVFSQKILCDLDRRPEIKRAGKRL